ncbi:MAG: hypothetical protein RLY30_25 [Pseudomonadota bacterium]
MAQSSLKIILVSQKGGVGKSSIAANLAAWFSAKRDKKTCLLDFDPHGSSSTWVRDARQIGLEARHHPLDEAGARRWLLAARTALRHATDAHEVVVADLTWTAQVDPEFLMGFDLVLVPSGVSEIELAATTGFVDRYRWVFSPADRSLIPPTLVLCPSRIRPEQVLAHDFSGAAFSVPFVLAPPVFDEPLMRSFFRRDFLPCHNGVEAQPFLRFAEGIATAAMVHRSRMEQRPAAKPVAKPLSGYNSVLSRYLAERTRERQDPPVDVRAAPSPVLTVPPKPPAAPRSLSLLSRFLSKTAEPAQANADKL